MWAVFGLGNPGREYRGTRHNAGFMFIHYLARSWNVRVNKRQCASKTATVRRRGTEVVLAMPQTFMNNSGLAVRKLLEAKRLEAANLVVVYDDLDLPLGEIRVRPEGSAGTHKGMLSVIQEVGTSRFPRIRLGIGFKPTNEEAADFVLSEFTPEEREMLEESLEKAREALELILDGRITQAMNRFN